MLCRFFYNVNPMAIKRLTLGDNSQFVQSYLPFIYNFSVCQYVRIPNLNVHLGSASRHLIFVMATMTAVTTPTKRIAVCSV